MSEHWAYNLIDVKISPVDNRLGETSPNDSYYWFTLSSLGILRGRPKITPSTLSGSSKETPGKDGNPYSVFKRRGNATIEFELLIVDAWPFANLQNSIEERVNNVTGRLLQTRRMTYTEPGREYSTFFVVYNTTVTEQDVDEKVSVLQIKMEVHPFKYNFSGNAAITIPAGETSDYLDSFVLYAGCNPIYKVSTSADENKSFNINYIRVGEERKTNTLTLSKTSQAINDIYIDTEKCLAYKSSGNQIVSMSQYLKGYIENMRWPVRGADMHLVNHTSAAITVYPRSGKII